MAKQVKSGLQRRMEDGLVPDSETCGTESDEEGSNIKDQASADAQEAAVIAQPTETGATAMHAATAGGSAAAEEREAAAEAAAASQLQKWWKDCIDRKSAADAKCPTLKMLQNDAP